MLMTKHQKEIIGKLLKRRSSIIEMDATHGTNQYDFKMITVMTKNGNHQGEPLAHMFCNKETSTALKTFLTCLRKECGKLCCRAFMSDCAEQYFRAWFSVMVDKEDDLPRKLLCAWHVIESFKKQLVKIS